jgi:hypothetical protein
MSLIKPISNMATSATTTIKVEGFQTAKLYKHWDGYPDATLPWLKEFNQTFTRERGDNPSYKFAQLIRSSAFDAEKYDLDSSKTTGWGVIGIDDSAGEDYEYRLMADGTVTERYVVDRKGSRK